MTGALIAVGTLLLATAVGLGLRARAGRVRAGSGEQPVALPAEVLAALAPGAHVTLVQLSTTFCAPCRQTRALLSHLAEGTAGLGHVDLDLTDRPELAAGLSVLRTPTTIAVDSGGVELLRVGGVPRRAELVAALRPHLPA